MTTFTNEDTLTWSNNLRADCDPSNTRNNFYVPWLEDDPNDPIAAMVDSIRNGEQQVFLTGTRKSGKSTQLERLKTALKGSYYVVSIKADQFIDASSPIHPLDFLLGVYAVLVEKAEVLELNYQPSLSDHIKAAFQRVGGELNLGIAGIAQVKLTLKGPGSIRSHLLQEIGVRWEAEAQSLKAGIADILKRIGQQQGKPLLVVIDQMENQLGYLTASADPIADAQQKFFSLYPDQWRFTPEMGAQLVMTMPPFVPIEEPGVQGRIGPVFYLPNFHVLTKGAIEIPDPTGLGIGREILRRRAPEWVARLEALPKVQTRAPTQDGKFIEHSWLDEIVYASGGNLNVLLHRLAIAMVARFRECPPEKHHERLEYRLMNYLQEIRLRPDMRAALLQLRDHPLEKIKNDQLRWIARAADNDLVGCYSNGERWFSPHPYSFI